MDRSYLDRLTTANSERVLLALTQQQHLHPARSIIDTVRTICETQGFSEFVADQALRELALDARRPIGRLSRHQVRSLAEGMESAWQVQLANRISAPRHQHA